jgi:ABC-type transport system involved in Fe-S cluster assembly fused permease/ATPase subunit
MHTLAHCHSLSLRFEDYLAAQWRIVAGSVRRDSERGSVTIEQVIWAVAIIGIVAIVVTAITNYVTSQAGKIK